MTFVWLGAMVVFCVIEAATLGITAMWFAIGSLAALISCLFGAPLWLQILWFILVSGVTLAFTRPVLKKHFMPNGKRTNADRVLDMQGVVTERIVNEDQTGRVRIGDMDWKAHHACGTRTLEKGTVVRVADIDGNRLLVEPTGEVHGTDEEEEDYISIDIL